METERRHFSRIHFNTLAELSFAASTYSVEIIDLSLKGALVRAVDPVSSFSPLLSEDMSCTLAVNLEEEEGKDDPMEGGIFMEARVARIQGQEIGLRCVEIDLDSITLLRRVVELNLGNEDALFRELEYLANES
ncbi:MAG: PilZ domain-containing protein [Zoogloeaceae bacterium]|jgi:NhaP-type Na+/H+ and K+/H+ antiporter|nr:PilZ domain-containing protein [Zoogloeaceae bacterium]